MAPLLYHNVKMFLAVPSDPRYCGDGALVHFYDQGQAKRGGLLIPSQFLGAIQGRFVQDLLVSGP